MANKQKYIIVETVGTAAQFGRDVSDALIYDEYKLYGSPMMAVDAGRTTYSQALVKKED